MNDQRFASPAVDREERVSVLAGDRLCTHCGYNLTGQPVLREPHYQMLIVRCPECAAVASVQEYPLLGRWASRWATLLAAIWFLVLFALWVGSAAAMFGLSLASSFLAAEEYGDWLMTQYQRDPTQQSLQEPVAAQDVVVTAPSGQAFAMNPLDFENWWQTQDRGELLARAGGYAGAIEWQALYLWLLLGILAFVFGCVWATVLLARGRWGRLAWGGAIAALSCAFASIPITIWHSEPARWSWDAAMQHLGTQLLLTSVAFAMLVLAIGLLLGRKLARLLIRALLPPRMRSSLAVLWITDGLTPPAAAHVHTSTDRGPSGCS